MIVAARAFATTRRVEARVQRIAAADRRVGRARERRLQLIVAARYRRRRRFGRHLGAARRLPATLLFLLAPVARHAAFAARFARFLTRPLVRGPLLMRRFTTLARDLALLAAVHRCKAAILFCHAFLLALACSRTLGLQPMCHGIGVTLEPTRS